MQYLNFSWIIDGKLAGHGVPSSKKDLFWLKEQGILALVRMAEKDKCQVDGGQIEQLGLLDCHEPVTDFAAPQLSQIMKMVQFIARSLEEGRPVGVSCTAGQGRTGTILACYLVNQGFTADKAIGDVRMKRPGSIETKSQEDAVTAYEKLLNKKNPRRPPSDS